MERHPGSVVALVNLAKQGSEAFLKQRQEAERLGLVLSVGLLGSYEEINEDITIYGLNPHMHFRGKRMSFEAKYPDGSTEMLLSVPNYNFNWQRTYHFAEPVKLPKGSQIVIRNAWDNSAENPHNPDPSKAVQWGDQSFNEMFFATYTYHEDF